MASLDIGGVYVIFTSLTKPTPKEKIVICICPDTKLFVWFNTEKQAHGVGQLPCNKNDHAALDRDCFLDLSRVTTFLDHEIAESKSRAAISDTLKERICKMAREGIATLASRYSDLIISNFCTD